jgi:hypothetical protein
LQTQHFYNPWYSKAVLFGQAAESEKPTDLAEFVTAFRVLVQLTESISAWEGAAGAH